MRRHEKEIADQAAIDAIIAKAQFCRLAMCDGDQPYVVPLCFGRDGQTLYMHCAAEGRKLDLIRRNPKVCFEMAVDTQIVEATEACKWSFKFRSVIGEGVASIIEDVGGKRAALAVIMRQYSGQSFEFPKDAVDRIVVIKVDVVSLTAKESGY